ncbi:potassium transporter Kup [Chitinimonas taiwanensis]|jgi:KUP system potassium uptake protein|uniref:Probable potassium transport system protein Kup n=1 Tax=Chitinimonas taiwanensis DSM 18899 TaxID=1121279 RepID=A0A1K2HJH6_9NEIS|nr:potassium transporter Kup [Chitinimonas taiwanensis]SFZ76988.1 KUP system potassium uptake protein [Chitinimonas taiwanensis DSM 18899]
MHASATQNDPKKLAGLTLAALGVVYGDIGTSPLYAMAACFSPKHGLAATPDNVLGILSLITWALLLVISLKYVLFMLRADNNGEGGILSLMALALRNSQRKRGQFSVFILLGITGAALFYGDGALTPAISVLSAVEGLKVIDPSFGRFVIPLTILIIIGIFAVQKHGTGGVGRFFGPIVVLWFLSLGALGINSIANDPSVLKALSPTYAVSFFLAQPLLAFLSLGAVVLVVTGGEAIYADMGHFGRKPIQIGWFVLVLPGLLLNYYGQGALILHDPSAADHPFFMLAPESLVFPLVLLATAATVIASQALISGVFSITRQAVQLGYMPRMSIIHTSDNEIGQIYIPGVNWALCVAVLVLVLTFKTSGNLEAAYGFSICGIMVMTTMTAFVALKKPGNPRRTLLIRTLLVGFITIDLALLAANIPKIPEGGWFPVVVGVIMLIMMFTWKRGRRQLFHRIHDGELPLEMFVQSIEASPPHRVDGTAIFMTGSADTTPHALLHNLKHNKVLHEQVVFLTIQSTDIPRVAEKQRLKVTRLSESFWQIIATYGFTEDPSVPEILALAERDHGLVCDEMTTSFFLSRETIICDKQSELPWLQLRLFAWMQRNASRPTDFYKIPPNRVVEMGTQVDL